MIFIKILIYIFIIVLIFLIPLDFFTNSMICVKNKLDQFKKNANEGTTFLNHLSNLEMISFDLSKVESIEIPSYKFYSNISLLMIDLSKKYGARLKENLKMLKEMVLIEIKFDNKIKEEKKSAIFQFIVVVIITWGFIFISQQMIEFKVSYFSYLLIILLQFIGLFLFYFFSKILYKKMFFEFEAVYNELISVYSMIEVGLPLNHCIKNSKISEGTLSCSKSFEKHYDYLNECFDRLKNFGIGPLDDIKCIIGQIRFIQEERLIDFHKKLGLMKFMHLALFFLPAYFIYLASIFKFFMEQ